MKRDKAWLINELTKMNSVDNENQYFFGYETAIDLALDLAVQLEEPEKVVIPQFVAEWIEHCKANDLDLYEAFGHSDMSEEVSDLIGDMDADVLARAWLDGYEVEKEKLYRVDMYGTDNLLLTLEGNEYYFDEPLDYVGERPNVRQEFTESEIKAIDERYWAFSVEVAE